MWLIIRKFALRFAKTWPNTDIDFSVKINILYYIWKIMRKKRIPKVSLIRIYT